MPVKRTMPTLPPAGPGADQDRRAFIDAAPGKATLPWQQPHVRDDLMVQMNVKQPERLALQIDWLAQQIRPKITRRQLIEDMLREGVAARLKAWGIDP